MFYYEDLKFQTCPKVYAPAEDTFLLADNLILSEGEVVLEIGTGTGLIALTASKKASQVIATDINHHAVKCARANMELNDINNIKFHLGNLFQPVQNEKFDLILFNTPYLPSSKDEIVGDELDAAWDGGADGRRVIDLFLNEVKYYLNDGGRVQLVQSSLSDNEKTLERLEKMNFDVEITDSERFFFEEIVVITGFYSKVNEQS
ncbi:HemK2/MTQ2 family protein methyltransferase [Methanobacterium alcaliphilum]|uniref:HemK2/MTQ2 family protein methyltransferase n=1 Tax=Methanobacterium alcaliphilum TaxID=392018 RepID=UPI00200ADA64|nr:HemK2/MTQ2 family protein methyltransferase [Methanobacterium alcaliphilum]MCK9151025.1 class I SAM-dependent methyltransferase [Methanobacterium alcaliphilum]